MNFVVVIFAFCLSHTLACSDTEITSNTTTCVKFLNKNRVKKLKLKFEAFIPQGLRITVPSIQGIDLLSFQAKVNLPIGKREEGTLVWEIINPLEDTVVKNFPKVQLLIGDIINFWVRIQSNGVSLQSESLSHIIKELTSTSIIQNAESYSLSSSLMDTNWQSTHAPVHGILRSTTTTTIPITYDRPVDSHHSSLPAPTLTERNCECNADTLRDVWAKMNATVAKIQMLEENISPLEEKLSSLTETVVELIKNMDIGTKLLLTGNLPVRTNPVEDVRHLIVEKLKLYDLSMTILQAEYKRNGISFEVSSSIDKLRILKRSNDILSKLSYQIIDPERPAFDVRMARK